MLSGLLAYGVGGLDFSIAPANAVTILLVAQLTQWVGNRAQGAPYDPKSALISSLSLCLLLRTNALWVAAAAAVIAVGSKFVVRWNGKHMFNPTNLALVVVIAAVALGYALRSDRRTWLQFLGRFASVGYALPGTVLAVGLFAPIAAMNGWMQDWLDVRWGDAAPQLALQGSLLTTDTK
jgi:ABC-type Fe3+ transport system permease subunit